MQPGWLIRRLRAMGPREVSHRLGQAARARLERAGIGRAHPSLPSGACGLPWLAAWPSGVDREAHIEAADRILSGRFQVFAIRECMLGFPPRWNRDPKSGREAPLEFGKTLDYRDEALVGDIKYLWEPNRHLELVTLAQAYVLTADERYSRACRTLLDSWLAECPYPKGPNWTSSLELGIRLLNWSFAWHLLGGDRSPLFESVEGAAFRSRWLDGVYRHCHFIEHHRSYFSSANNHLLGELLGLFVAAVTWPLWKESSRWQELGREGLEQQALAQNAEDGVNLEQGVWYHHEVADMLLLAGLVGRANGIEFSRAYWQRWEAMLVFVASIMDVAGHMPAIGDSDDAVMVRLSAAADFSPFRSLLATGAGLLGRADLAAKAGRFDDKSLWLLGDDGAARFAALSSERRRFTPRREFPVGGYYILGTDFDTAREVRIVADAGPLGFLSIAAHGHADALAFTLSAGGRELLVDAGTFAYHTNRKWRDYFRGTSAHNTVRIDGVDQSVPGGNFLWSTHASAWCERFELGPDRERWAGRHDGYLRLPDPVAHLRELDFEPRLRLLRVTDSLEARGRHSIEMFWHFSEACELHMEAETLLARVGDVELKLRWPADLQARLVRGSKSPILGWISRSFDVKEPAGTLVVSGEIKGSWSGVTEIVVGDITPVT